jgi:antitoxin ParD1/3/4
LAKFAICAELGILRRNAMTTMNISLPDEMKAFIEAQMGQEGYASAREYLRNLIREAQKREARKALDAKLLEGLEGPAVEMTRDDWESIRREAQGSNSGKTMQP